MRKMIIYCILALSAGCATSLNYTEVKARLGTISNEEIEIRIRRMERPNERVSGVIDSIIDDDELHDDAS